MNKFDDKDDALLDALGVEVEAKKSSKRTTKEERIIAGFEEVQRFVAEHGRVPSHGPDLDIFERIYAVRLDRLRTVAECRTLLEPFDYQGVLTTEQRVGEAALDDDELLTALGVESEDSSIKKLQHVRPNKEIRAAEEIANRERCADFDTFKPLFDQVQDELRASLREMIRCNNKTDVKIGDLFVLNGQTAYIVNAGELFTDEEGREDRRLRIVFSNGTESKMLRRSFQKRLWDDDAARRISTPSDMGPLFSARVCEEDLASGVIYVLRSRSTHPEIKKNRELIHKIGFTTGSVETRIADAANQATYLLAEVEVVATYALYNLNASKLESIIHRIFGPARLNIEIKDRFGKPVVPREWFLVPLSEIAEAVERIRDGSIANYHYDPETASLVKG